MGFLSRAFGRFWKVEARQFVDLDTGAEIVGHSQGSGVPAGDPGTGNRVYLDTDDGALYTWDGAAWAAADGGPAALEFLMGHTQMDLTRHLAGMVGTRGPRFGGGRWRNKRN